MRRALELAKRGWGATSPNPMVGAVLVKNGRIIAEGWHTKDGAAHAEIECLRNASESPKGADLYVTLEPCSTRGRTGACCDAIISAGIARVFAATKDPNPAHSGRAEQILKSHSIECSFGILEEQAKRLNFIFNSVHRSGIWNFVGRQPKAHRKSQRKTRKMPRKAHFRRKIVDSGIARYFRLPRFLRRICKSHEGCLRNGIRPNS